MARHYTGKRSISIFEETKANGVVYVYERTTWYGRDKGYREFPKFR